MYKEKQKTPAPINVSKTKLSDINEIISKIA